VHHEEGQRILFGGTVNSSVSHAGTFPYLPSDPWTSRVRFETGLFSAITIWIAGGALYGWFAEIESLRSILPGLPLMKFNTALCLLLLAVAMFLDAWALHPAARTFAWCCNLVVVTFATLSFLETALDVSLGVDQILVNEGPSLGGSEPGHMSGIAACALVALSLPRLIPLARCDPNLRQLTSLGVIIGSLMSLVAYIGSTIFSSNLVVYFSMPAHTALCLLLMGIASLRISCSSETSFVYGPQSKLSLSVKVLFPLLLSGFLCLIAGLSVIHQSLNARMDQRMGRRGGQLIEMVQAAVRLMERPEELEDITSVLGRSDSVWQIVVAGGTPMRILASNDPGMVGHLISNLPVQDCSASLDDLAVSDDIHVSLQDVHHYCFSNAMEFGSKLAEALG
jgi:hypothetical protein